MAESVACNLHMHSWNTCITLIYTNQTSFETKIKHGMILYKHVVPRWQGTYQIFFIQNILDIITSTPFQEYSHHKFVLLDSFKNSINRHQILFQKQMSGILNFKVSCIGYSYCFHISSQIFFIPFDLNIQSSCIQ